MPFHQFGMYCVAISGGGMRVLLFWDKDQVECKDSWVGIFSVLMVVAVKGDHHKWVLTKVYGPTSGD